MPLETKSAAKLPPGIAVDESGETQVIARIDHQTAGERSGRGKRVNRGPRLSSVGAFENSRVPGGENYQRVDGVRDDDRDIGRGKSHVGPGDSQIRAAQDAGFTDDWLRGVQGREIEGAGGAGDVKITARIGGHRLNRVLAGA